MWFLFGGPCLTSATILGKKKVFKNTVTRKNQDLKHLFLFQVLRCTLEGLTFRFFLERTTITFGFRILAFSDRWKTCVVHRWSQDASHGGCAIDSLWPFSLLLEQRSSQCFSVSNTCDLVLSWWKILPNRIGWLQESWNIYKSNATSPHYFI